MTRCTTIRLPGEGGHVDFAPNSEEEGIILEELRAEIGHVSAGPGHPGRISKSATLPIKENDYEL